MKTPVVGVGASAGGLEALNEMLSQADRSANLAFVIVQHLDPNHQSMLAELLARHTGLAVRQIEGGEHVEPGTVHIIPPGRALTIQDGKLQLTEFKQARGLRRPIDDFFVSLARDQKDNAACVILSGTGADGASGLRAVKELGGVSVAQDPATAKYDGMPLAAVDTGLVDFLLPPSEIVGTLTTFFDRRESTHFDGRKGEETATTIDSICVALRDAVGHDFKGYKRATLGRRIERRMQVLGIGEPDRYLARLQVDPEECNALFRDLLIHVTRFFRDPEHFETLRTRVVEPLIQDAGPRDEIRIWVPGCSSGEEAYSIAMLFARASEQAGRRPYIQMFATDIDQQMLNVAREGRYPSSMLADIPEAYREAYTIGHENGFDIVGSLREMIRFTSHSVIKDPPFSRLDLISCRNLLIYFDETLQQSVMPIFHYAARPGGYLFLGPSESIGRHEDLFTPIDQHAKLFRRTDVRASYPLHLPATVERHQRSAGAEAARRKQPDVDTSAYMRRVLERYASATLLVDSDGAILNSSGRLSKYFEFGGSHQTRPAYATMLARPGLRELILPSIRRAKEAGERIVARDVAVVGDTGVQSIELIADPMPEGPVLLVFRDTGPFKPTAENDLQELGKVDGQVEVLEDELRVTRHRLRSTVEELETANEELKSSNEEMMSMNEELQSTNEELATVNDELKSKIDQLVIANADIRNFLESSQLALVVIDEKGVIRNFTAPATSLLNLKETDRGRSIKEVSHRISDSRFIDDVNAVLRGETPEPRTLAASDGLSTWTMRTVPYRSADGESKGATILFVDVSDALRLERTVEDQRKRLEMAVQVAGIGVWEYDVQEQTFGFDATQRELLGLGDKATMSLSELKSLVDPRDRGDLEAALSEAASAAGKLDFELRLPRKGADALCLHNLGRLVPDATSPKIIGVSYDVTPERRVAELREMMLREMNHRVKNLFAVIGGLIGAAAKEAGSAKELARDVQNRIAALGRAHMLTQGTQQGGPVDLRELVTTTVGPFQRKHPVRIEGPRVQIAVQQLTPLALILHEWATNSSKYGALSPSGGDLNVTWAVSGNGNLSLRWSERPTEHGAAGHKPDNEGFGTRLVALSVQQLEGQFQLHVDGERTMLISFPISLNEKGGTTDRPNERGEALK